MVRLYIGAWLLDSYVSKIHKFVIANVIAYYKLAGFDED